MTVRTSMAVLGRLISYALHPSRWDDRLHDAFEICRSCGHPRQYHDQGVGPCMWNPPWYLRSCCPCRHYKIGRYPRMTKGQVTAAGIAGLVHYPDCWDTVTYPGLYDAVFEIVSGRTCSDCYDFFGHAGPGKPHPMAAAIADIVRGASLSKMKEFQKESCPNCDRPMVWLSNLGEFHCFKCGLKISP